MKLKIILAVLLSVFVTMEALAQQVDTVIGSGLWEPMSAVVGPDQNIYVANSASNRIVKYIPGSAVMTTLAGSAAGLQGYDNRNNGFQATFYSPEYIIYALGGFVVSDNGNNCLRFVSTNGAVTTLAGITNDPVTVASKPANHLAITNTAMLTYLNAPSGLAVDNDTNIFIADSGHGAIRVLMVDGNIKTLATGLFRPSAVAVGNNGDIWVADTLNNVIRVIHTTGTGTNITTTSVDLIAGQVGISGANDSEYATNATFSAPSGLLWMGGVTGLLVSDKKNNTIRQVVWDANLGAYSVRTLAGAAGQSGLVNGALTAARFSSPSGLSKDTLNGGVLVADRANNAIRRIQMMAAQPPAPAPTIGFVRYTAAGKIILFTFTSVVLNNDDDEIIAIQKQADVNAYYTVGPTPSDPFDTTSIPDPAPPAIGTPAPDLDVDASTAPSPLLRPPPYPDVILKARCVSVGRLPSAVVQARIIFQVAAPTIIGDNAAYFTVTNQTAGAQIFYTVNGQEPVFGETTNNFYLRDIRQALTLNMGTNQSLTFKIRGFKRVSLAATNDIYLPSDIVTKTFDATRASGNQISFGFASGEASSVFIGAPGQLFQVPVTLSLAGTPAVYSLGFDLAITNANGSTPAVSSNLNFNSCLLEKVIINGAERYRTIVPQFVLHDVALNPTGYNSNLLAVAWLETRTFTNLYNTFQQDLITYSGARINLFEKKDGKIILGSFTFQIPTNALSTAAYQIQVLNASASSDWNTGFDIIAPTNGALHEGVINSVKEITMGIQDYIVGDISNFRWFNAGDFGDRRLTMDDVHQTFMAAMNPPGHNLNRPVPGSDFFDAMDSSNGHVNPAALAATNIVIDGILTGDGFIDVDDIYVTLRRSLDPNVGWVARFWSNGIRQSILVSNALVKPTFPTNAFAKMPQHAPQQTLQLTGNESVEVVAGDSVAGGATVSIPIYVVVNGVLPVRHIMMNALVKPFSGTPELSQPPQFQFAATGLLAPAMYEYTDASGYGAVWVDAANSVPGLAAGTNLLGTLVVTLPTGFPADGGYSVSFEHFSASPNGIGLFPKTMQKGHINPQNYKAPCDYTLSANQTNLSYNAQTGSVIVTTTSGCSWVAVVDPTCTNWVTITAGASGTNSDTVAYSVASNGGPSRRGLIYVEGTNYVIFQAASPAPSITSQPANLTVWQNDTASFSVTATGAAPLAYQWHWQGTSGSGSSPNWTNQTLVFTNTSLGYAGSVWVVVTNAYGVVTSAVASLIVTPLPPPAITSQPTNLTIWQGDTANFNVAVTGAGPLTYQWYWQGTGGIGTSTNWTNATLVINNVPLNYAGSLWALVSNPYGAVTSAVATLTVNPIPPPIITSQPTNVTVWQGETAHFSVVATGAAPLTYQWYWRSASGGGNLPVSTNQIYAPTNVSSGYNGSLWAVVYNAYGSVTSSVVTLLVMSDTQGPLITINGYTNMQTVTRSDITLSGTVTDTGRGDHGVYMVEVSASIGYYLFTNLNVTGSNTFLLNCHETLMPGTNSIRVKAWDTLGNATSDTINIVLKSAENSRPTMFIKSPANGARVSTNLVTVSGTANDAGGVGDVWYLINGKYPLTLATGTTNWSLQFGPMAGTNTVVVYVFDRSGNYNGLQFSIFNAITNVLTVTANGTGTVSPNLNGKKLEIGKFNSMTALPGKNWLFSNWVAQAGTGAVTVATIKPACTFQMVSNLTLTANFVTNLFIPRKGDYLGSFFPVTTNGGVDYANVDFTNSGAVKLSLTDKGTFTGQLLHQGTTYPFAGAFNLNGQTVCTVLRGKQAGLQVKLALETGAMGIKGAVGVTNGWESELLADQQWLTVKTNQFQGTYSLVNTNLGTLTVKVLPTGSTTVSGKLADKTVVSQSTGISTNGDLVVYQSLYSTKGMILGRILVSNLNTGNLHWQKLPDTKDKQGFSRDISVTVQR
ncbi:MAG: Ig-like domain-containing protein [Verrucomicrobiota bacterium]